MSDLRMSVMLAGMTLALAWADAAESGFSTRVETGRLQVPELKEVSGLAVSRQAAGLLWMVNDSGGQPTMDLVAPDGAGRGRFFIKGAKNVDWEDLAAFVWKGKNHVLIADTGDNAAKRDSCSLYVVREPDSATLAKGSGELQPEWMIRFRYPDGPRDCESVAVDARQGKILLLSKRTHPPEVYELPLQPPVDGVIVARRIGTTDVESPPGYGKHPFGAQPTSLDISPDGSMAAVLTYVAVFVFDRRGSEGWSEAFARKPRVLPPHGLPAAESLAFSIDGRAIFVTSEGTEPAVLRFR